MGFVYVHPCISLSGDSKSKEAFPLHPWHYFLFRPVIYLRLCSVLMLSAPFSLSLSSPSLSALVRPQNATRHTKLSPSWKIQTWYSLCHVLQTNLTYTGLAGQTLQSGVRESGPASASDFPKTVWLPDSLTVVKGQAEEIVYFHWLHLLLYHHVHFRVVVRKWELQSLSNIPAYTYSVS